MLIGEKIREAGGFKPADQINSMRSMDIYSMLEIPESVQTFLDVIIIIAIYVYWKFVPNNGQMLLAVKKIERQYSEVKAEFETELTNMYDFVEATLKPMRKREQMRINRQKKEDEHLKSQETSRKSGGILRDFSA